jgi:hypothetical protein
MSHADFVREALDFDATNGYLELRGTAMHSEHTFHWREDDGYGDLVTVHDSEPFTHLRDALGSRELATAYVELGGRAESYVRADTWRVLGITR